MTDETTNQEAPAEEAPTEPTPDPMPEHVRLGMEAADEQNPEDSQIVECPKCGNPRRKFLIVDGQCDSDRAEGLRASQATPELGWPEVRTRRDRLIAQFDWTQLGDIPEETRQRYEGYRQELRDVTGKPDAFTAWYELDRLEANTPK